MRYAVFTFLLATTLFLILPSKSHAQSCNLIGNNLAVPAFTDVVGYNDGPFTVVIWNSIENNAGVIKAIQDSQGTILVRLGVNGDLEDPNTTPSLDSITASTYAGALDQISIGVSGKPFIAQITHNETNCAEHAVYSRAGLASPGEQAQFASDVASLITSQNITLISGQIDPFCGNASLPNPSQYVTAIANVPGIDGIALGFYTESGRNATAALSIINSAIGAATSKDIYITETGPLEPASQPTTFERFTEWLIGIRSLLTNPQVKAVNLFNALGLNINSSSVYLYTNPFWNSACREALRTNCDAAVIEDVVNICMQNLTSVNCEFGNHNCKCFCSGTPYEPCSGSPQNDCSIPVNPGKLISAQLTEETPRTIELVHQFWDDWLTTASMGTGYKYQIDGNTSRKEDCTVANPQFLLNPAVRSYCRTAFTTPDSGISLPIANKQSIILPQPNPTTTETRLLYNRGFLSAPDQNWQAAGVTEKMTTSTSRLVYQAELARIKEVCHTQGDGFWGGPIDSPIFGNVRCVNYQRFSCYPNCDGDIDDERLLWQRLENEGSCRTDPLKQVCDQDNYCTNPCTQAINRLPQHAKNFLSSSSIFPIKTAIIMGMVDSIGGESPAEEETGQGYDQRTGLLGNGSSIDRGSALLTNILRALVNKQAADNYDAGSANDGSTSNDYLLNLGDTTESDPSGTPTDPGRNKTFYYLKYFTGAQDARIATNVVESNLLAKPPVLPPSIFDWITSIGDFINNIYATIASFNPKGPYWVDKIPDEFKDETGAIPDTYSHILKLQLFFNRSVESPTTPPNNKTYCLDRGRLDSAPTKVTLGYITPDSPTPQTNTIRINFFTNLANLINFIGNIVNILNRDTIELREYLVCEAQTGDLKEADISSANLYGFLVAGQYQQQTEKLKERMVESETGSTPQVSGIIETNSDPNNNCFGSLGERRCNPGDVVPDSTGSCSSLPGHCGTDGGECCSWCDANLGEFGICGAVVETQIDLTGDFDNQTTPNTAVGSSGWGPLGFLGYHLGGQHLSPIPTQIGKIKNFFDDANSGQQPGLSGNCAFTGGFTITTTAFKQVIASAAAKHNVPPQLLQAFVQGENCRNSGSQNACNLTDPNLFEPGVEYSGFQNCSTPGSGLDSAYNFQYKGMGEVYSFRHDASRWGTFRDDEFRNVCSANDMTYAYAKHLSGLANNPSSPSWSRGLMESVIYQWVTGRRASTGCSTTYANLEAYALDDPNTWSETTIETAYNAIQIYCGYIDQLYDPSHRFYMDAACN